MPIENDFKILIDAASGIQPAGFTNLPQDTQPPYIVVTKISSPRERTHDGPSNTVTTRMQVDVYAKDYKEGKEIAVLLYDIVSSTSTTIAFIDLANEADGYEEETKLHRCMLEFTVNHYETIGGN